MLINFEYNFEAVLMKLISICGEELNVADAEPSFSVAPSLQNHLKPGTAINFNGAAAGASSSSVCPSHQNTGPVRLPIKVTNITNQRQVLDNLYTTSKSVACNNHACLGSIMAQINPTTARSHEEILDQAVEFLEQYFIHAKKPNSSEFSQRLAEIATELDRTGTYTLTTEELHFGTKTAWRNAARCIGRIQWNNLQLQDARHVATTAEMYQALLKHIELATNGGNLRSFITIFPQRIAGRDDFRVWNNQLIGYAGYRQEDGSVIGDPGRVEFTQICERLGWKGKGGRFDILPIVLSAPNEGAKFYEIPEELILRVKITHPTLECFDSLGMEWYALPAVAEMQFDCGGLIFPGAPFNGWYMGTEIGARDICDPQRYDLTEKIAKSMGLDTSNNSTLWKDKAMIETNVAVLHSYQKAGVTIVDHHSASDSFIKHMNIEYKQRGGCPADWVWIVPPVSGSITSVFHQEMLNYSLRPSFEYQDKAWRSHKWIHSSVEPKYSFRSVAKGALWAVRLMAGALARRVRATILFATETGKSEGFAQKLAKLMKISFSVRMICMEDYNFDDLFGESLLLVISSTFGNGEAPDNGKEFWRKLCELRESEQKDRLTHLKYGVFALGSRQYPSFCTFGKNVDKTLQELGATPVMVIGLGDELRGQESDFNGWGQDCYENSCQNFDIKVENNDISIKSFDDQSYDKNKMRITEVLSETEHHLQHELARLHHKKIITCKIITRVRLQSSQSERQTILVRLTASNPASKAQFNYEPGDHLAIFPTNPKEVVNVLIGHLTKKGYKEADSTIQVQHLADGKWYADSRLPVCSLRVALNHYLDITTPPSQKFLHHLIDMANDNWDSFRLTKLANDIDDYEKWRSYNNPNMADVLNQFPSIHMNPEFLLTQLPLLQPRYYSVSSSRKVTPDEVQLTMDLVSYHIHDGVGPQRLGVCSSFIDRLPDVDIPCFIRSAPSFRMPEKKNTPVIMICAGSGIAPFRGFWLERQADLQNGEKCGKMFLFFGCRNSKQDHIYEPDLNSLVRKGVIHEIFVAFSREKERKKLYVQDLVFKQRALLNWLIINESAHIYVCGHSLMADGVKKAFLKMFETDSHMSQDEAQRFLTGLTNDGRYHEDVFGVY